MSGRRWIFVHIPKTGGTSIEASLPGHLRANRPDIRHWSAVELRGACGDLWNTALTFSVIRNPWDRAVSAWAYQRDSIGAADFPQWLWHGRPMLSQWAMLTAGEQVIVNHLIRFEELRAGFGQLVEMLRCEPCELLHLNKSQHRTGYRDYYTEQRLVDLIPQQYPMDVREFGYTF